MLSEKIRKRRKELGLTQEQVASSLGVSTPAVNKWERGGSLPDIGLLPALARLLEMDMNELFSFREDLSDLELTRFINALSLAALGGDPASAFEMAERKIWEYPRCDALVYSAACVLSGLLSAEPEGARREAWDGKIGAWLEQSAGSRNEKIRQAAVQILAGRQIERGEYEKAEELINGLPDQNTAVDRLALQVRLMSSRGEDSAAAILLEGQVMKTVTRLSGYLYSLSELEDKTGRGDLADRITDICAELSGLFGLWGYTALVPRLILALRRKDREAAVPLLRQALEEAEKPWDLKASPLFYRLPTKSGPDSSLRGIAKAVLTEIKQKEEYAFLRGDPAIDELLSRFSGN